MGKKLTVATLDKQENRAFYAQMISIMVPVMLQQLAGASTAQQWIGGLKNYLCAIPTDEHDNYSAIGIMVTEK